MENQLNISKPINDFLAKIKKDKVKKINICLHDNPDPDAIGAGLGTRMIFESFGYETKIYYSGDVSHPQNKTMINVLNIIMEKTTSKIEGVNVCVDGTPANSCVDSAALVIDHHKNPVDSEFQIVYPSYGACCTIVWEIIQELKLSENKEGTDVYTSLLLGIRTDTNDLISENMSDNDFKAYQELLPLSDKESLQKIMNYPLPKYLYDKRLALHIEGNNYERNGMFVGGVGYILDNQRDVIAILSEEYSRMESVSTSIIFAIVGGKSLHVSIRSSNVSLDVGQMCRELFQGGGTTYKGGAKIPLGFYEELDKNEKEEFWNITCKTMFRKVFKENFLEQEEKKGE